MLVIFKPHSCTYKSIIVTGNQLRQDLHRWLSPPDPSTNHNIACSAHHEGTATWFLDGSTYKEWKSVGSESLLWIHGKCALLSDSAARHHLNTSLFIAGSGKSILWFVQPFLFLSKLTESVVFSSSTIIQDVKTMCDAGQASMAYFYFDFRDISKQHWRDLVPSLLTQLCSGPGPRCDVLSRLYSYHDDGKRQPNDDALKWCLIDMLALRDERPTYLVIDALDECSNVSGIPTPRERVLQLVKELVELHMPNVHICVTSRPEVDIRDVLEPLASRRVSLHD
jgi:NACHT domain-containing protein